MGISQLSLLCISLMILYGSPVLVHAIEGAISSILGVAGGHSLTYQRDICRGPRMAKLHDAEGAQQAP